jgi:hypothetical protein
MLTLVLWQHVVFLCVSRTLFRMSLVMVVRRMLCSLSLTNNNIKVETLLKCTMLSETGLRIMYALNAKLAPVLIIVSYMLGYFYELSMFNYSSRFSHTMRRVKDEKKLILKKSK